MENVDVVIVGGGFAGMCAARAIGRLGKRVLVLEARTGADPRFRGELMHPPAVEVLRELDLLDALIADGGVMVDGFAVILGEGKSLVELPYAEVGGPRCRGFSMEHTEDGGVLPPRGRRRSAGHCTHRGQSPRARASGRRRRGRAHRGGRDSRPSHRGRGWPSLEAHGSLSGSRRTHGCCPIRRRSSSSRASYRERDMAMSSMVLSDRFWPIQSTGGRVRMCIDVPVDVEKGREGVLTFLRDHCLPHVPEPLRSGMARSLQIHELEMCATHSISTRRCAARGVVLIGDSCGCAHPITAAGMMVALHDIQVLASELAREPDLEKVLLRYQDRRYEFVRAREILTDGLYDVFRLGDAGAQAMRDGLQHYWTSGPKARAASMALLAGLESRLGSFIAEYFSVVARSARAVVWKGVPSWSGLGKTARTQLVRTSELVINDMRRRLPVRTQLLFGPRVAGRVAGRGVDQANPPA